MSIWNDLVESCRDAVGREVNDLNDVADVVDELNREVCRLKKELSKLHQPTVTGTFLLCKSCGKGKSFDMNYNCFDCGKSFQDNGL